MPENLTNNIMRTLGCGRFVAVGLTLLLYALAALGYLYLIALLAAAVFLVLLLGTM